MRVVLPLDGPLSARRSGEAGQGGATFQQRSQPWHRGEVGEIAARRKRDRDGRGPRRVRPSVALIIQRVTSCNRVLIAFVVIHIILCGSWIIDEAV